MANLSIRSRSIHGYIPLILAIISVQVVDRIYFSHLHHGLKYPDYFPIMFLAIFIAWRYIAGRSLIELIGIKSYRWQDIKKDFLEGAKYGTLVTAVAIIAGLLSFQTSYSPNLNYFKALSFSIFGYLIFIPVSAFYEVLHYRGVYLSAFFNKLQYLFIILSSTVFALVHLVLGTNPIYYPINIFLLGAVLALLRVRGKSVITCTGFHAAWNFILISLAPVFGENTERYVEFNSVTTAVLALALGFEIYLAIHQKSADGKSTPKLKETQDSRNFESKKY
ncbi:MAG: type II CAAX endopeptidase family protein [Patescibacteria group bacterium]